MIAGRGSPDPARMPDRRSPSFGVCYAITNAFDTGACGEHGRPSVRHSGGVRRPAPSTGCFPDSTTPQAAVLRYEERSMSTSADARNPVEALAEEFLDRKRRG